MACMGVDAGLERSGLAPEARGCNKCGSDSGLKVAARGVFRVFQTPYNLVVGTLGSPSGAGCNI